MEQMLKNISFRDDAFVVWKFSISSEFLNLISKDVSTLIKKVHAFHQDYIEVSQKYSLGEIIPLSLLDKHQLDLKELYKNATEKQTRLNKSLSFFPLSNAHFATNGKFSRLHPSSCKYNLSIDNQKVSDYFFINRKTILPLSKFNFKKLPVKQENFTIWGEGLNLDNLKSMPVEEVDLGFSIRIYSEFWFQKTFYKSERNYENGYDNSFLAYHNTPRLNSYLQALKDIWVNKYHWNFKLDDSWYDTTENGILLDNKIIYQEDIDKGNVEIPKI